MSRESAKYSIVEALGGVEILDATYHRQNFSRHSHEGYTVGVIETGAQQFFRDGFNHIAPQHSIILVNADEIHNGQSAAENGWSYHAMYPLEQQLAAIRHELGLKGAPYFPEPVVYDKHLSALLRHTFCTLQNSDNQLLGESLLYSSLVQLITRHAGSRRGLKEPTSAKNQLQLAKQFLDDHPAAEISLENLSNLAGLSPFHLLRQFQKQFGLAPHAYQIQSRLRLAKTLIRQGMALKDVAADCGFHDQSHLHRHFKKNMGITPGQYAKAIAGKRNFIQS